MIETQDQLAKQIQVANSPSGLTKAQHERLLRRLSRARSQRDKARLEHAEFVKKLKDEVYESNLRHFKEALRREVESHGNTRAAFEKQVADLLRRAGEKALGLEPQTTPATTVGETKETP